MSTISTDLPTDAAKSAQPVSISIQDIQNLLILLDLAAQRGAFRGNELSQVGQLFDKTNAFVQAAIQQSAPPEKVNEPTPLVAPPAMPPQQPVMSPVTSPMMPPFAPKIGA